MLIIVLFFIYFLSFWVSAGLVFAFLQGKFSSIAERDKLEDLGSAILLGLICGALGPIGVGVAYLSTGFGEYGWKLRA